MSWQHGLIAPWQTESWLDPIAARIDTYACHVLETSIHVDDPRWPTVVAAAERAFDQLDNASRALTTTKPTTIHGAIRRCKIASPNSNSGDPVEHLWSH
jgi:hypothetical protein